MANELRTKSHNTEQPAVFTLMNGDPFFRHIGEVHDRLARRAFELFNARGRQDGHDLEDWFRAESELFSPMPVQLDETDDELIFRADVPGFRDKAIEVRVEPRRLVISGKREETRDEKKWKTVYSERRSNEVFRALDLSEDIDPDRVRAKLQDGTLEISLPKARPARKVPVSVNAA
jgi:HSP20 family protein